MHPWLLPFISISIIISTSIDAPLPSPSKHVSQSSQFDDWKNELVAGALYERFDDAEEMLDGDDCLADGIPQKECKLDCWLDSLLDGKDATGFCGWNGDKDGTTFCWAE